MESKNPVFRIVLQPETGYMLHKLNFDDDVDKSKTTLHDVMSDKTGWSNMVLQIIKDTCEQYKFEDMSDWFVKVFTEKKTVCFSNNSKSVLDDISYVSLEVTEDKSLIRENFIKLLPILHILSRTVRTSLCGINVYIKDFSNMTFYFKPEKGVLALSAKTGKKPGSSPTKMESFAEKFVENVNKNILEIVETYGIE